MKSVVPIIPSEVSSYQESPHAILLLKKIAENGGMNKWDLSKKAKLRYQRVDEAIASLIKKGLVQEVEQKRTKNRLPSAIYDLTFTGALFYLSLQELKRPIVMVFNGESKEEL